MGSLKINGKEKEFANRLPETLSALLVELGVDSATVVAEVDGEIVERKDFDSFAIKESQKIELIRFVGGG